MASAFAGASGAFCGSPLFLIKTQLQSQAARQIAVGHQHGHRGALTAIKTIYSKHGVGLYTLIWFLSSFFKLFNSDYRVVERRDRNNDPGCRGLIISTHYIRNF